MTLSRLSLKPIPHPHPTLAPHTALDRHSVFDSNDEPANGLMHATFFFNALGLCSALATLIHATSIRRALSQARSMRKPRRYS